MPDAAFYQGSFLGGEWSQHSQGDALHPLYRTALNLCRNAIPIEEGAVTRRPGTRDAGVTRNGNPGILRQFHFDQSHPYTMEFTDGFLRFRSGVNLALEGGKAVTAVSSATPAQITVAGHGYTTGNQVIFSWSDDPTTSVGDTAALLFKQFAVTVVDANNFTIADSTLGSFNGSRVTLGSNQVAVGRIVEFTTPYTAGKWADIRTAQDETEVLLFHPTIPVHVVTATVMENASATGFAQFTFTTATFIDGPYLDPPEDGSTVTPSGTSGTITLTETGTFYTFVSTDVGRLIRLFSEPADWDSGTAYSTGDHVKFNGLYWTALQGNTGKQPGTDLTNWAIDTTAAKWTWGTIASVVDGTHVTVTLAAADPNGIKAGGNLLYTTPIKVWRLGVYSDTTGYPTCGAFHEGRLWLGGSNGNRIDSSMSNKTFEFSPTLLDGTVADNCGISAVFRATDTNRPYWILPDGTGLIVGTQAGEWVVRASQLNDPLTPTSIQVHRCTEFGSENVEALLLPLARLFVQRNARKLIEYTVSWFSTDKPYQGDNLALKAKHFTAPLIEEIAYQKEKTPIIWARTGDGALIGCTYRRDSQFSNQPVTFAGWHKHTHGCGRLFRSIQVGPSVGGDTDTLTVITEDTTTSRHYVELMTDIFEEDDVIQNAWFVDGGVSPAGADIVVVNGGNVLRFYGLDQHIGETITAWVAGVDAGDYTVSATGTIDVPLDQPGSLLTTAYIMSFSA